MYVKKYPQSPMYGSPPPCSPFRVSMERDAPSPEPMVYSFNHICQRPQNEMRGKHTVTVHGAPHGQKAYIQWGAAWFSKGIVNNSAVTTLVQCSLQHDTFHLGLGRPEPH